MSLSGKMGLSLSPRVRNRRGLSPYVWRRSWCLRSSMWSAGFQPTLGAGEISGAVSGPVPPEAQRFECRWRARGYTQLPRQSSRLPLARPKSSGGGRDPARAAWVDAGHDRTAVLHTHGWVVGRIGSFGFLFGWCATRHVWRGAGSVNRALRTTNTGNAAILGGPCLDYSGGVTQHPMPAGSRRSRGALRAEGLVFNFPCLSRSGRGSPYAQVVTAHFCCFCEWFWSLSAVGFNRKGRLFWFALEALVTRFAGVDAEGLGQLSAASFVRLH